MDGRLTRQLVYGLLLLFVLGIFKRAGAEEALNVAVAANFAPVMELISKEFTEKTGMPVQLTISSSGRLFAQIQNRAPFDLYFSGDTERPGKLHSNGLCRNPKPYATGQIVLWSRNEHLCTLKKWKDVVHSPVVKKIAMANPATAPYGTVAKQVCEQFDNWSDIEQKLVYGTNVGQAFQYAQAGVVQVSFVALSLAMSEMGTAGYFWDIPGSLPVEQMACVLAYRPNTDAAERFLRHVNSPVTAPLLKKFGYL